MATLRDFFEQVVPTAGLVANITIGADKRVKHHIFKSVLELAKDSGNRAKNGTEDLYFALSSFQQGWYETTRANGKTAQVFRTQDNVMYVRSLWLDIDVGKDKPYKTTKSAVLALRKFLVETKLPKPWIVASGSGGLHVYWTLTTDIDSMRWQAIAERIHSATITHDLAADASRTRDCASILRVPGSKNFKGATPNPVKLLCDAQPNAVELFETLLAYYRPMAVVVETVTDTSMPCSPAELAALFGKAAVENAAVVELPNLINPTKEQDASVVIAGCPQMADQKGAPEPVWRGMLAVMRHCVGGIKAAHELSKKDPRYTKAATDEKLQQLIDKDIAPYKCSAFDAERPEVCHKCQYKGIINSPISVPESKIAVVNIPTSLPGLDDDAPAVVPEQGKAILGSDGEISYFKPIDTGRYKVTEAGCYEYIKSGDDGFWNKIYEYPIYPIQRIKDRTDTGELSISYIFRKHSAKGAFDFQVGGDVLGGMALSTYLGSVGFLISPEKRKSMTGLMVDILKASENDIEETSVANNLGWDSDHKNFLLGNKIYKATGDVVEVTPKGRASEFSALTVPKGDLGSWSEIANVYNRAGLEWAQVVVGTAFASPLMSMGGLEQAALLFVTGDKGVGKSTVLQVALSVYGDPLRLMINKNDTEIARYYKLGVLNSISATFDEMTDLSPKEASALAYQITQGRGKDKMGDMGKTMQRNSTHWSCLPVMSANDSIIAALAQHSFDSTAQMSRVLEVEAVDFNDYYGPDEVDEFQRKVRSMPHNFGTAGDAYIRYIVKNQTAVEDMILKMEKIFIAETKLNSNYRFWSYMCTRILVGCSIAKKLGLIAYDIKAIFKYLKDLVSASLSNMSQYEWQPDSLLSDFLNSHLSNRIDVSSANRPADMIDDPEKGAINDLNFVKRPLAPGRDLMIRVELDTGRGYISRSAARNWCKLNKVPYDRFIDSLKEADLLRSPEKKMALGKGTAHRDTGRSYCLEITMPSK